MDRRSTRSILWHTFEFAKQDRKSLLHAYASFPENSQEVKDILADTAAIERLQKRIFGTTQTRLDQMLENAEPINILNVRGLKRLIELSEE